MKYALIITAIFIIRCTLSILGAFAVFYSIYTVALNLQGLPDNGSPGAWSMVAFSGAVLAGIRVWFLTSDDQ